jgi:ribosome-binding factor A
MANNPRLSRRHLLAGCSDPGPDDGTDPKDWRKDWNARRPGRKALQLCSQVAEVLAASFADCGDAVLRDLVVTSVAPAPNAGRLLVTVAAGPASEPRSVDEVLGHLHRAAGWLRTEVAAGVNRRKTPELMFRVRAASA